jgi:DGQHR domain-containing protein
MPKDVEKRAVAAIRVNQWLRGWDKVSFLPELHRKKPPSYFYIFSLPAVEMRSLCGIYRRQARGVIQRSADLGIQREHDPERSEEIARFVEFGYPWSTTSEAKRKSSDFNNLRKPGWLPTAIVINVLSPDQMRGAEKATTADPVSFREQGNISLMELPYEKWSQDWRPTGLPPFEVIDGQHRLWAFDDKAVPNFELPVVAFHGLDVSWQAYLFWTINIKPKRISPSLAYDLYPLLRGEDWLEGAENHLVYRETRAQELTEMLWSHKQSPWYDRINMLGERQSPWVTQSAWIKSLTATFVRPWTGRGGRTGGLFGSRLSDDDEVLGWNRAQQAAFLIKAWSDFKAAILAAKEPWAADLRGKAKAGDDLAFYGQHSLISTDQGVRGFLSVLNDVCIYLAPRYALRSWTAPAGSHAADDASVTKSIESLRSHDVAKLVGNLAIQLATFDWRSSSAPSLDQETRRRKLVFRGSGGYKEIRAQLLEHLSKSRSEIANAAKRLLGENV